MKKILVADDEKIALMVLKEELEEAGYEVFTATDGEEASQLIKKEKFDIALLDVYMPHKNGYELIKEIKLISPDTIIILITAYASIENAVNAIKLGAEDYINKPYDMNNLLAKIKQMLEIREQKKQFKNLPTSESKLIGKSTVMQNIHETIEKIANLQTTVLITGESGTGKGVIAKEIHSVSKVYQDKPFVRIDCGSLPENLIESELFGYEKGAFTGANESRTGKFELAKDGIIFLDEIGTLPLNLQTKLLTVLQDRYFYKIGGTKSIPVKARIIAATNENLEDAVLNDTFREDLFYRLNVIRIEIPPLRYRKSDIPLLAESFIQHFSNAMNKKITKITDEFMTALQEYDWPGNIRELENAIESAIALSDCETLTIKNLPVKISQYIAANPKNDDSNFKKSLENQEIIAIVEALEKFNGHREKTAQYLGITRRSLQYKLKKYNLLDKS